MALTLVLTSQMAAGEALGVIFPPDIPYTNYRAKRLFTDTSSDCQNCLSTYDYDSCQRCWNAKPSFIPFHAKRSSSSMVRIQRGSGCGCCYQSRFTNRHCCQACSLSYKRTAKRSQDAVASPDVIEDQLQADLEKRAVTDANCFCCIRYNGLASMSGHDYWGKENVIQGPGNYGICGAGHVIIQIMRCVITREASPKSHQLGGFTVNKLSDV
nr:hypothetical protein BaRGS_033012 [Batillaria attramentaria]